MVRRRIFVVTSRLVVGQKTPVRELQIGSDEAGRLPSRLIIYFKATDVRILLKTIM